jgi:DNA-binding MarR family transcriptional regulator
MAEQQAPQVMNGMDIAGTAAAMRTLLDRTTAGVGIRNSEFLALRILAIRGPLSPKDLHDYLAEQLVFGLRPENAATLLERLEERGLLSGTNPDGEGPAQMTEAGRKIFDDVAVAITAVSGQLYSVLDQDELVTATKVMAQITERATELAAEMPAVD